MRVHRRMVHRSQVQLHLETVDPLRTGRCGPELEPRRTSTTSLTRTRTEHIRAACEAEDERRP